MFKVIIAGGRDFTDWELISSRADELLVNKQGIEIVSGCCDTGTVTFVREDGTKVYGADGLGERYAKERGHKVIYFPADWKKHGKAAGPIRNKSMGVYGNAAIVAWDGRSRGSKNMIEVMRELGKPARVIHY